MKTKIYFIIICLVGGTIVSCTLDSTPIECPADYSGNLTDTETKLTGDWILSGMNSDIELDLTNDNVENPNKDLYAQYVECDKDASYRFNTDRSYSFAQGQNASNCANKRVSSGSWKLSVDQLSLVANCNVATNKITFNEVETEFSFTNDLNVKDVRGLTTLAKITFVYSKVVP